MPRPLKKISRRGKSAYVHSAASKKARTKDREAQAKMNIYTDYPLGTRDKAVGSRKKNISGGRGKMRKVLSKTGRYTGGGF